jgi:hypothetical protein
VDVGVVALINAMRTAEPGQRPTTRQVFACLCESGLRFFFSGVVAVIRLEAWKFRGEALPGSAAPSSDVSILKSCLVVRDGEIAMSKAAP